MGLPLMSVSKPVEVDTSLLSGMKSNEEINFFEKHEASRQEVLSSPTFNRYNNMSTTLEINVIKEQSPKDVNPRWQRLPKKRQNLLRKAKRS